MTPWPSYPSEQVYHLMTMYHNMCMLIYNILWEHPSRNNLIPLPFCCFDKEKSRDPCGINYALDEVLSRNSEWNICCYV